MPIQPDVILGTHVEGGIGWSGGGSSLLTGLSHYWTLNEASGTRADSIGSATMTDNNTVGSATGMNFLGADLIVVNGEYFSIAHASDPWPATGVDWTLSLWIKPASVSGTGYFIINNFGATTGLQAYASGAGALSLVVGGVTLTTSNGAMPINSAFHHVVMSWNSADTKHRIQVDNGTVYASAASSYQQCGGSSAAALFGTSGGALGITGVFDEMGLWHRILTSTEIAILYNSGTGKFYPSF